MQKNINMSQYTSMKTGGVAEECYFPKNAEELCQTVHRLADENRKCFVLGNMSNVLIPDGKVPFVPIVTTKMNKTEVLENDGKTALLYAESGVMLTKLAYSACKSGLSGLVFAYGIPGSVGGAVYMNAGAYGSEMSAVVEYVDCFDPRSGEKKRILCRDCGFGYRKSVFCENGTVILGAGIRLTCGNADELVASAKETMHKRAEKQPLEYPSCGSAFKRPEGYFAGELIEKCGLKGKCVGGAAVSEKHAGFIVNKGGATSGDVTAIIDLVSREVFEKFGVRLEPEIKILK